MLQRTTQKPSLPKRVGEKKYNREMMCKREKSPVMVEIMPPEKGFRFVWRPTEKMTKKDLNYQWLQVDS